MNSIAMLDMLLADPDRALRLLGEGPARARTEFAVRSFIAGLRCLDADPQATRARLEALDPRARPFAWEGVGLAAAAEDEPARFDELCAATPERAHLLGVGEGWASALRGLAIVDPRARSGESPARALARWSALDGHGFCVGLLRRRAGLAEVEASLRGGPVELALDQGFGRSLYFVHAGRPEPIAAAILGSPSSRRPALWAGVGVASVFTDGLDEAARASLRAIAGDDFALGERLGAAARAEGTPLAEHLDAAEPPLLALRRASRDPRSTR